MSIPIIAIIGRPNVGKSTLFNCLTGKRDALVADIPGLTRDRQYGYAHDQDRHFIVIDTGGLGEDATEMNVLIEQQVHQAITEATLILFLVDAQSGLTAIDEMIANRLRRVHKPILLVVNKIDGTDSHVASAEFYRLGFEALIPIAAAYRKGIHNLLQRIFEKIPVPEQVLEEQVAGIKVAIVGKPNVGKSTLINRMLGDERVITSDQPGTTRDSIFIPFERQGQSYTLIDTAGVRRRAKVTETVEKFSIIKTLQAINASHIVVLLIDAREGITDQDMRLLGFILDHGKSLIIAVNKWDGLTGEQRAQVKSELERRLPFLDYVKWHFISALHGTGVGDLFDSIKESYQSAMVELSTPKLTRILEDALEAFQPPLVKGKRVKLRYAHPGGHNPPIIVIHGSRTELLPDSYKRYLENTYRKALKLIGTPVRIELRSKD
ncbi:MAG: ribosome biogenesis GTPase Der [Gammaproteobacteria bacterium]|nr:ribosome biogenesis GTPase Der [Gammaproteobacteria bacterium]